MVQEASASGSSISGAQVQGGQLISESPASAICSLGLSARLLSGYLIDHLRRHYQGEFAVEEPSLREEIWRRTQDSGILIESIWKWTPQMTQQRPGILVKRNSYQNLRASLGDKRHGLVADERGNPKYETFWIGSHTVFCIGRTGGEVEILATETQRELTQLGPVICDCLNLMKYQVREFGAVQEIEESTENFVVPITIAMAYHEAWTLRALVPVLKGVTIASLLDC